MRIDTLCGKIISRIPISPQRIFPAVLLMLGSLCVGSSATAQESGATPETANAPLAEMPSPPGPHMPKIAALGDNEWLALGAPEADPRWGSARGRSWSSNQPVASNLGGMFVFAEGVHAFVKPDQHYMNDLWFYDINAHRWLCLYPGIDTRTIVQDIRNQTLTISDDGVLVRNDGEPLPPLLIHAYGYLGYDPERKKFLTLGRQFGNYFTTGEGGVFEEANRLFQEQRRDKQTGPLSPFFYDVASGRWEVYPVNMMPGRQPYGANLLVYVASRKQFWYGGSDGAWYFDQEQRRWDDAAPQGTSPTGIDHCAAYDPKRDRIYYYQHDGEDAIDNFLIYDVSMNHWTKPDAAGTAPRAATSNDSIFQFDTVNDRLVIIRWSAGEGEPRAVYSYDPEANAWADPLPLPENVRGSIKNGSHGCYDPNTNAFYCHFASDSQDDGTIWVYRFKK